MGARSSSPFFHVSVAGSFSPIFAAPGGPSELRTVASLAASFGVPYVSHGGGPAALSVLLCAPSAIWPEAGIPEGGPSFPVIEVAGARSDGPRFRVAVMRMLRARYLAPETPTRAVSISPTRAPLCTGLGRSSRDTPMGCRPVLQGPRRAWQELARDQSAVMPTPAGP